MPRLIGTQQFSCCCCCPGGPRWLPRRFLRFLLVAALFHIVIILFIMSSEDVHLDPSNWARSCLVEPQQGKPFPKNFHQIWTTEDIPQKWKVLQEKCRAMNKDYTYMLWTHSRIDKFMEDNYPWFMDTYHSYPYQMQRLDAARYFILYHYGGVYADMDMECLATFDHIFANITDVAPKADIVLGATEPLGVTSSFLMAKKGHGFMDFMTKRLKSFNRWYVSPYWTVIFSTGPLYLYRSTLNYPCHEQIHIIPAALHTRKYLDHKHASTWHNWDGPIFIWFDRNGRKLLYSLGFLIACLALWSIYKCSQRLRELKGHKFENLRNSKTPLR